MIKKFKKRSLSRPEIRQFDDPILSTVCDPIESIAEAEKVMQTMGLVFKYHKSALGVAAPQIGVPIRLIAKKIGGFLSFMANPVITESSEEMVNGPEGCLSYPGRDVLIRRRKWICVKYRTAEDVERETIFWGLEARVIQHEIDHLDGVCKVRAGQNGF